MEYRATFILLCAHVQLSRKHHCAKKLVTTMLTYPWKCTVLHCNHMGNTWKPLVLMTRHFDYCPSASEGDNQSVRSSAPVVSRCFPGGYNVKLYISTGRLAWWLLAFLCCAYSYKIRYWSPKHLHDRHTARSTYLFRTTVFLSVHTQYKYTSDYILPFFILIIINTRINSQQMNDQVRMLQWRNWDQLQYIVLVKVFLWCFFRQ